MLEIDGGKFTYGFFKFIDALAQVGNRPSWNKNIGVKMSASVVLEWRNLNLTFEKREFEFSKFNTTVEEKRILDNGMRFSMFAPYFYSENLVIVLINNFFVYE